MTIFDFIAPSISDKLYIFGTDPLFVPYDSFKILPLDNGVGLAQIEAFIFQGNSLPPILDLECGCLTPIMDL